MGKVLDNLVNDGSWLLTSRVGADREMIIGNFAAEFRIVQSWVKAGVKKWGDFVEYDFGLEKVI